MRMIIYIYIDLNINTVLQTYSNKQIMLCSNNNQLLYSSTKTFIHLNSWSIFLIMLLQLITIIVKYIEYILFIIVVLRMLFVYNNSGQ